jgi:hypothetical protein
MRCRQDPGTAVQVSAWTPVCSEYGSPADRWVAVLERMVAAEEAKRRQRRMGFHTNRGVGSEERPASDLFAVEAEQSFEWDRTVGR